MVVFNVLPPARVSFQQSLTQRMTRYLAVFTIEDEEDQRAPKNFNILLRLADEDLKQFLYKQKYEEPSKEVMDFINECAQLSDALRWLHSEFSIDGEVIECVCNLPTPSLSFIVVL